MEPQPRGGNPRLPGQVTSNDSLNQSYDFIDIALIGDQTITGLIVHVSCISTAAQYMETHHA
jgi:hypothetical protein